MSNANLRLLQSEELRAKVAFTTSPRAIHALLARSEEVKRVRGSIWAGLSSEAMREFVAELMQDFSPGKKFTHEIAIAGLAVALEDLSSSFADEFIARLARLDVVEMAMCTRVVRICNTSRKGVTRNFSKSYGQTEDTVETNATLCGVGNFRQEVLYLNDAESERDFVTSCGFGSVQPTEAVSPSGACHG